MFPIARRKQGRKEGEDLLRSAGNQDSQIYYSSHFVTDQVKAILHFFLCYVLYVLFYVSY